MMMATPLCLGFPDRPKWGRLNTQCCASVRWLGVWVILRLRGGSLAAGKQPGLPWAGMAGRVLRHSKSRGSLGMIIKGRLARAGRTAMASSGFH
jgi:hypothetical protein